MVMPSWMFKSMRPLAASLYFRLRGGRRLVVDADRADAGTPHGHENHGDKNGLAAEGRRNIATAMTAECGARLASFAVARECS